MLLTNLQTIRQVLNIYWTEGQAAPFCPSQGGLVAQRMFIQQVFDLQRFALLLLKEMREVCVPSIHFIY